MIGQLPFFLLVLRLWLIVLIGIRTLWCDFFNWLIWLLFITRWKCCTEITVKQLSVARALFQEHIVVVVVAVVEQPVCSWQKFLWGKSTARIVTCLATRFSCSLSKAKRRKAVWWNGCDRARHRLTDASSWTWFYADECGCSCVTDVDLCICN